jgi:hypothetical protein
MQLARPFSPQQLNRPHAVAQVLVYRLAVKVVGHAGQFYLHKSNELLSNQLL